jgi:hypothetical protein
MTPPTELRYSPKMREHQKQFADWAKLHAGVEEAEAFALAAQLIGQGADAVERWGQLKAWNQKQRTELRYPESFAHATVAVYMEELERTP